MWEQPLLDMSDLDAAKCRFDEYGQVSTQMSKSEYVKLYNAAGINEKMLRLGKRRDIFGRISFYLNLVPSALRTALLSLRNKLLEGAYDFYVLNRDAYRTRT